MIVVASSGGRGGVCRAMDALRRGDGALDAVVAGIERAEREGLAAAADPPDMPGRHAPRDAGAPPALWGRWRQELTEELNLELVALARMEWLISVGAAVIGPAAPGAAFSIVARDRARDIACGVSAHLDDGADRRVILALRAGRSLGDALRGALADLDRFGTPLVERVNLHALARDRLPLGASHRQGDTFLYLRAEMAGYVERPCLYVA